MSLRRADDVAVRNRRWATLLVVFLAVVAIACIDPWYGYRARALCPGVDVERVSQALSADTTMETRRIDRGPTGIQIGRFPIATFWSTRDGVTASVHVSREPDELEVAVTNVSRSEPALLRDKAHLDHVCALLSREIDGVQEWRTDDCTHKQPSRWLLVFPGAWLLAAAIAAAWFLLRRARRRRRT